jgi:hypothetical protein
VLTTETAALATSTSLRLRLTSFGRASPSAPQCTFSYPLFHVHFRFTQRGCAWRGKLTIVLNRRPIQVHICRSTPSQRLGHCVAFVIQALPDLKMTARESACPFNKALESEGLIGTAPRCGEQIPLSSAGQAPIFQDDSSK